MDYAIVFSEKKNIIRQVGHTRQLQARKNDRALAAAGRTDDESPGTIEGDGGGMDYFIAITAKHGTNEHVEDEAHDKPGGALADILNKHRCMQVTFVQER